MNIWLLLKQHFDIIIALVIARGVRPERRRRQQRRSPDKRYHRCGDGPGGERNPGTRGVVAQVAGASGVTAGEARQEHDVQGELDGGTGEQTVSARGRTERHQGDVGVQCDEAGGHPGPPARVAVGTAGDRRKPRRPGGRIFAGSA